MKKRVLSLLMSFVMVISLLPATIRAAETDEITVQMTVYDQGQLAKDTAGKAMLLRSITVRDLDTNGKYTIDEALQAAHGALCPDGAAGYSTNNGWVTALWGDNSGAFGYYVNDDSAQGVSDEISSGDRITAFIYCDQTSWSDRYAFFDKQSLTVAVGEEFELSLSYSSMFITGSQAQATAPLGVFDKESGAYSVPAAFRGEKITDTFYMPTVSTDTNEKVKCSITAPGIYYVTAPSASPNYTDYYSNPSTYQLVPPLCVVTVLSAEDYANYQVVQDAKAKLTWASLSQEPQTALTTAPTLPSTLIVGEGESAKTVSVSWKSTNPALSVSEYNGSWSAYVDRPAAQDATGDLTATLTYTPEGGTPITDTKVFPVTVKAEGVSESKESVVSLKTLMDNIAKSYTSSTDAWTVLDMAAYGQNIKGSDYGYSSEAPSLLAESALNGDCGTLLDSLKTFDPNGSYAIYTTPYALLAYDAAKVVEDNSFTNTRAGMKAALVSYLNALGSNYADTDEVTPILAALAPYYSKGDSSLDAAVSAGIAWLSAKQSSDGTYAYYGTSNSNSSALAVVALSALGIDAHRDSRFIKNGHSALEGLMSFALSSKDGFGYKGNVTKNALSTEQGFRALVSYARFVENGGKAYNIYLDAQADKAAPADPQVTATVPPAPVKPDEGKTTITVRLTLSGDTGVWLNKSVSVSSGVSAYDVLTSVLAENGYTWEGTSTYISYITHPNGKRLGEFTNGKNSGWLYKVNGVLATVPIGDHAVDDGDSIVFYYTNDWTLDPDAGSMSEAKEPEASSSLAPSVTVSNGAASAEVSSSELSGALDAAEQNGESSITIAPALRGEVDTVTVSLPLSAAAAAAEQGVQLVIDTGTAQVVLDAEVLTELTGNGGTTLAVEISAKSSADLTGTLTQDKLAGAAIAQVTVTAGGKRITSFGGRTLTVELPVDKDTFRAGARVRVYLFSDDGSVERTAGLCVEKDGKLVVRVETKHLSTFVVLPETALPFTDVDDAAWYADAVRYAYDHALLTGVSDEHFLPDGTATRAQLVTILHRLAGSPAVDYLMQFSDVSEAAWYAEAVRWAASEGIVTGCDDGTFRPDDALTREQLAAILYRYVRSQGGGFTGMWYFPLRYEDAGAVSAWANEAMRWCVMRGILTGTSATTLEPSASATRAQLATILQRFCTLDDEETPSAVERAYRGAAAYLAKTVSAPTVASIGGEWTVLALARGGEVSNPAAFDAYRTALERTLRETNGVLSERKYTEYSRVILALSALGEDARSFAGYDLTLPLADYDKTVAQGVNGAIFALLALDSADYPMPRGADTSAQATREKYVAHILSTQRADGGWSLKSDAVSADPDLTAMALQSLAAYRGQREVGDAITVALNCLSALQNADGGFSASGAANAESCAQVLLALNALGIDTDDARFVKNGHSALDALLTFQTADGGFRHIAGGETNLMASEQAACALAALVRAERGESSFYRMNSIAASKAA